MLEQEKIFYFDDPPGSKLVDSSGRIWITTSRPRMLADGKVYIDVAGGQPGRPLRLEGVKKYKKPQRKKIQGKSLI